MYKTAVMYIVGEYTLLFSAFTRLFSGACDTCRFHSVISAILKKEKSIIRHVFFEPRTLRSSERRGVMMIYWVIQYDVQVQPTLPVPQSGTGKSKPYFLASIWQLFPVCLVKVPLRIFAPDARICASFAETWQCLEYYPQKRIPPAFLP